MVRAQHVMAFVLCMAGALIGHAQSPETHVRNADRYYSKMAYSQAIEEYEAAADLGARNEHVTRRLAECYMKVGDTRNGESWYAQVVRFLNREPNDLYMYAQALKSNGKYEEAQKWMDLYLGSSPKNGEPLQSNILDFKQKFTSTHDRFTIRPVSLNTEMADMAATWAGHGQVVFASSRDTSVGIQYKAAWNDQPFLDLFISKREPGGDLATAKRLPGGLNTALHEGPAVVAPDGSLWFTRSSKERGKNGIHRLSILRARADGSGWSGAEPFLFNNPEYSVGHPAISKDGTYFYFVSDMPGGFGGTDIYRCKDKDGLWGQPENLGPAINTKRNEVFPYLAATGTLYFSSMGLPGLGGLDVFAAEPGPNGEFTIAVNVGSPVNGPKDDFAFVLDSTGTTGYFTSDRDGGRGSDDIYSFTMHYPLEQRFLCTGTVIDDETALPMADAEVSLMDTSGLVLEVTRTSVDGKYLFPVKKDLEYTIHARMDGHFDAQVHMSTEDIEQKQIMARDVHLVPDVGIWLRGVVNYADKIGFVPDVKVSVVNMSSFYSDARKTDEGGDFFIRLQANEQFEVLLEKPGFFSISVPVNTAGLVQGVIDLGDVQELALEPVELGKPILLKHFAWSGSGDALDPAAKAALDQLADRLQVNPSLNVEIAVHADTRDDAVDAMKVTKRRAEVIAAYLRSKGIMKGRLVAMGYGITDPLNGCGPGVGCTAKQHMANQRVEYTVIGVLGS